MRVKVNSVVGSSTTFHHLYTGVAETSVGADTGGTLTTLVDKNDYTSNPIARNVNIFDSGYFLVEREYTETRGGLKKSSTTNWIACREVSREDLYKVHDPSSSMYATNRSPVYSYTGNNQEIEVFPAPGVSNPVRVWGLKDYSDIVYTTSPTSGGTDYPDAYWLALMYYIVAQSANSYVANATQNLASVTWTDQNTVTRLADNAPSLPYSLENILSPPPTFVKPVASVDTARLNAFLDDDDSELGAVAVQKISNEIVEYTQDIQNELANYTKEAKIWETEVNNAWKDADGDLQALIGEYQNEVQRYTVNVQTYTQDIQHEAGKVGSLIQKYTGNLQAFSTLAVMYENKFKEYMLSKQPVPQQQQGAKNAR